MAERSARSRESCRNVIVLGATGMLGNAIFRLFSDAPGLSVWGVVRDRERAVKRFGRARAEHLVGSFDALDLTTLDPLLERLEAPVLINCIGLVKQLDAGNTVLRAVPINTLLPHRLAKVAGRVDGRVIHFSTDCVFSGERGFYSEEDRADARDVYGLSKYLGEIGGPNAITLRTSIIGHELGSNRSLVDWFLSQEGTVTGFRRAIFSGVPTCELARVVRDFVIPSPELSGLFHVSAEPIDKFSLLQMVAREYGKEITIEPDDTFVIDRSLDSSRFRDATGYSPPSWPELVRQMHKFG